MWRRGKGGPSKCLSCVMSLFPNSQWDLVPSIPWFSGLQIWTELYTTGSPGSPACRQQIMELFSLCKHHASQLLYTHIHTCGCVCVYTMFTVLKSIQHTYTECLLLSRQCLNLPRPHGAIYFSFVDCSGLQDNRAKQHYCSIICICYWLCSLEKSDSHPRLYDLYDMAFPED